MKLAIVVQRYGIEINGGAELHARYIAERLAQHADVEVLTTCARDYITWRNEYAPGAESVNGLTVRRFPVSRPRSPRDFGRWSERVFTRRHSLQDELHWLSSEGPTSPALVAHLDPPRAGLRLLPVSSASATIMPTTASAASPAAPCSRLPPSATPALGLALFGPMFRGVRAIFYNSFEERALIQAISGNHAVPGVVVGVGSEIPARASARRFRDETGIRRRFALYVGRIDENKGCGELFSHYQRYAAGDGRLSSCWPARR